MTFRVPDQYRLTSGPLASDFTYGKNGAFIFDSVIPNRRVMTIASDAAYWQESGLVGIPWEHVSVHCFSGKRQFTPTWMEMCAVKNIFWDEDDTVIQFHPRKSDYVNNHLNTLHLWRPVGIELPLPPSVTVGIKEIGVVGGESEVS
jgi:hypothetical protein